MNRTSIFFSVSVISLAGCVSSPVPEPIPFYIRQSTPGLERKETLVLGLPNAVAGRGKVHIQDRLSGQKVVVSSSEQGTFSATISVGGGADLVAAFENADGLSEAVGLNVAVLGIKPELTGTRGPGVVSAPDAQGIVTVSNDGGPSQPLLLAATPETDVLVSNASNAAVASSRTDKDGRFSVKLAGAKGDTIHIMLVDPSERSLTSDYLSFTVP